MAEGDQDTNGDRGAVLITGASTGIGRATALRLDSLGFDVFAGVRKQSDAESLRAEASDRLAPVTIDVTNQASIASAKAEVGSAVAGRGLTGLFNNAGIGVGGPLEYVPLEDFRRQIEVNLTGQVAVTQAFLPLLRAGHGRIVFTGSVGGRVASPLMAPYSASKFALEAVADTLRIELQPWDIWVSIVEPGMIATNIWEKGETDVAEARERIDAEGMRLYGDAMDGFEEEFINRGAKVGIPPEKVAKAVEHALTAKRPRTRYLVGTDAKMLVRAKGLLSDRAFGGLTARAMKMPKRGAQLAE